MSQVDRGGLNYGIEVRDAFSSNLANFRSEVNKSKAAWREFKREFVSTAAETAKIRKDLSATTRTLKRRDKILAKSKTAGRNFAKQLGTEAAALRENTKAMAAQDRVALNRIKSLNTETRSVRRLTLAYNQLRASRGRVLSSRLPDLNTAVTPNRPGRGNTGLLSPSTVSASTRSFLGLDAAMAKSEGTANRISFTFRRLFGILAAFTVARVAVSGFGQLVSNAIRFNAEIEQTELGVAGLLTALGTVTTPFGEIADNAERLTLAQGEARRQLELLRGDALATAASYQELADTFQIALAPGFQAGLDLDEIRRLTVRISQAASAIGLPQNQLPEEIRSLLAGTITPRNTRIATSLGITNDDIRNAREAGNLTEFLEERFRAFGVAGEESLKNFSSILINLKDGLGQILRLGGFGFFEAFKAQLQGLLSLVAKVNDEGTIIFNEEAVDVVREIADGLREAVLEAGKIGDSLDLKDAASIGRIIGKSISGAAKVIRPLLSITLELLAAIGKSLEFFERFPVLTQAVVLFVRNLVIAVAVTKTLRSVLAQILITKVAVVKVQRIIALLWKLIQRRTLTAARAARLFQFSLGGVGIALAVIAAAWGALGSEVEDVTGATEALIVKLGGLPVAISAANTELEGQADIFRKFADDLEEATNSFELTIGTAGLSGEVRQQQEAIIKLRQETAKLETEQQKESLRLEELKNKLARERVDTLLGQGTLDNAFQRQGGGIGSRPEQNPLLPVIEGRKQEIALAEELASVQRELLGLEKGSSDEADRKISRLTLQKNELVAEIEELQASVSREVEEILRDQDVDFINRAFFPEGIPQPNLAEEIGMLFGSKGPAGEGLRELAKLEETRRDRTREVIESTVEQLKEQEQTEAEIASILLQQNRLTQARNELEARQNLLRAVRLRDLAEQSLGPFVRRGSEEELGSGPEGDLNVPGRIDPGSIRNRELEELTLETKNRRDLEATIASLGNVQLSQARANLALAEQRLEFLILERDLEKQTIDDLIAEAERRRDTAFELRGSAETENERLLASQEYYAQELLIESLQLQQEQNQKRFNLLLDEARDKRLKEEEDVRQTQDTFENVILGFREGLEEANKEVKNAYQIAAQTTLSAVQSLSGAIADTIVDAFDPTKDKTIEQRIGTFFQSIARQLIALTTQALILRYILGFAPAGTTQAAGAIGAVASREGGFVSAPGYASGGTVGRSPVRPRGLPASDTTPAWLTPGEYVVKKSAVSSYGADALRAINQGLIDPGSLRSLAGLTRRRRAVRKGTKLGYADGGLVGGPAAGGVSTPASGPDGGISMPLVAVPADEATMEALLNGGKSAYFAFLQANQGRFKAALGLGRG